MILNYHKNKSRTMLGGPVSRVGGCDIILQGLSGGLWPVAVAVQVGMSYLVGYTRGCTNLIDE